MKHYHSFIPKSNSKIVPPHIPAPRKESLKGENERLKDEIKRLRKAGDAMDNAISEIDPQRLERHRFMRMTDAEYMAVMLWRTTKDTSYNRA